MKNSKTFAILATIILVFAGIMGTIYVLGLKRKPLKHKTIPETVISWIQQLDSIRTDLGLVDFVVTGPDDWKNENDFGSEVESGYTCLNYDPHFIIYYHDDPAGIWKGRAETILNEANMAIPDLAKFMGEFPDPNDQYGRRLPIYLPSSEQDYLKTASMLLDGQEMHSGSSGLYIHGYGLHGAIAYGIILNPSTFPDYVDYYGDPMYSYHYVLRHEMNHYLFFDKLDFANNEAHRTWEFEGLADFFSYDLGDATQFVAGADSIDFIRNRCLLDGEFPNDQLEFSNSEYWAGESFYKFLKEKAGEARTSSFVHDLYHYPFEIAITQMFPDTLDVHAAWVESLVEKAI